MLIGRQKKTPAVDAGRLDAAAAYLKWLDAARDAKATICAR